MAFSPLQAPEIRTLFITVVYKFGDLFMHFVWKLIEKNDLSR